MTHTAHWPGLLAALALLIAAAAITQVPLAAWWHPAGWLLVFGGTVCATHLSTPTVTFKSALSQLIQGILKPRQSLADQVDELVQLSHYVRKNGLLSLQPMMGELVNRQPFLHRGLEMAMDNLPASLIKDRLATEIETTYRHTLDQARVFETAAGYAPTMGLMGAILGLMQTLHGSLANLEGMAAGVGSALSSTLLGIALANLMLLPVSARTRQHGRDVWQSQTLALQGILSIQAGEHPHLLREKLSAYLVNQPPVEKADQGNAIWEDDAPALVAAPAQAPRDRQKTGSYIAATAQATQPAKTGLKLPSSSPAVTAPTAPTVASRSATSKQLPTPAIRPVSAAPAARPKVAAAYAQAERFQPPAVSKPATNRASISPTSQPVLRNKRSATAQ